MPCCHKKRALPFGNARFCLRNARSRAALRAFAFASRLRGDAKDGRSVATRVNAIGSADASFRGNGAARHEVFARVGGLGAADGGAGIEHSVAAPRRLRAMFCLAPSRAKNSVIKLVGAASNRVMSALS